MKIFSHSEGNNADLSKFPVPAELSLPGTRYRMEREELRVQKMSFKALLSFFSLIIINFSLKGS